MRRINIFLIAFAVMAISCNTKEKKDQNENTNQNVEVTPVLDEHGHPAGTHNNDKVKEDLNATKNPESLLDTVTTDTEKQDPNKKPDIVAYSDPLVNVSFTDARLDVVYKYYMETKTALVNGDVKKAQNAASYLTMGYANFGVDEAIFKRVSSIVSATDIETQRELLAGVTEDVATMLKGKIKSGKVYRVYCPMAFDNTGGYWLASDKTIENPYFGEAMLSCGTVQAEIN